MTLDSLSESSLVRLEHYLNSNPYREYSMNKPYFPKTSQIAPQSSRCLPQQQSSILAFHELIDNQKTTATLDRLAYKLRMKSDLNIDTLRDTQMRRRYRHQPHHHHHHQQQQQQQNIHSNISDSLSSIPPSVSTKTYTRQPTSITMSTNTMKTLMNDDLSGIEGNAVRVGTLNDLIKQFRRAEFRLVRRPADYLDSASTYMSSNISTNDRAPAIKSHHHPQERPIRQPQALTEYRFNAPTFSTTPSRTTRDPTVHQGLIYQYRTRERVYPTDLPLLNQHLMNTPEQPRQRLNSLVIQERQPTSMSSHEKRVQELREKSLMRTEKQLCVCNKLTIMDPFSSNSEQFDSNVPSFQSLQQFNQQPTSANYIFPPVRPFGFLTKKTNEDTQSAQLNQTLPPKPTKKKRRTKKKSYKNSLDSLDKLDQIDINDEEETSQIFNDTIKSMVSLTDFEDTNASSKTININLNLTTNDIDNVDSYEQSQTFD